MCRSVVMGNTVGSGKKQRSSGNRTKSYQAHEVSLAFSPEWILIGYQGQRLGRIGKCVADFNSGKLLCIEVATPSQHFSIQWNRLEINAGEKEMRLRRNYDRAATGRE